MPENINQDQNNTIKDSIISAGNEKQPKKVYNFKQICQLLSQKDKGGTYHIQSQDEAMSMITKKSLHETEAFQKERWELVKSIFYCFHSPTTGIPESIKEMYMPAWDEKKFLVQAYHELNKNNRNVIHAKTIDF